MRIVAVLWLSCFLIMTQGCAVWGIGLTLTAKENDFPISFSEGIFGYNNEIIVRDGYEVVHHFTMEKSHFTWNAWSYFMGNPKRFDLSDEFEELVISHKGEAIVNLRIKAENRDMSIIYILTGLVTLGLIAPSSVNVTIEGDVIRLTPTTTAKQNDSIYSRFSSVSE